MHLMISRTEGIRSTAPVRWRSFEGLCAVHWEARGEVGARGYYLSPDPRVMLFFNDVSRNIVLSDSEAARGSRWRPMLRALFVPAGVPMWTRFGAQHTFSHLDLHLDRNWLLRRLAPVMGQAGALTALRRPVEMQDAGALAGIAEILATEISTPSRGPQFAEQLALAMLTGLVEPPDKGPDKVPDEDVPHFRGGLTPNQLRRLHNMAAEAKGRLTVAEMSRAVGLSEGWFCHAFKKATGKTPLQWQQEQRISMVKDCLATSDMTIAEIALRHDFSDQGHLTRMFRRYEGTTPSAWRRESRAALGLPPAATSCDSASA